MPSSGEYLLYVLDLLRLQSGVTYKKMMGEYLLYADGVLFGGVYDDRFLLKKTASLGTEGLREETPYPGAKAMLLVETESTEEVARLVGLALKDLRSV